MKQAAINKAAKKKRMKFSLNGFLWLLVTAVISFQLVLDYWVFGLQQKKSALQEEIVHMKKELEDNGAP